MSEDEVRLHSYLDNHPDDGSARLVLADLLEERGEELPARVQRWLARLRKWPDHDLTMFHKSGWHWWSCADQPERRREHAVVPSDVQKHMPAGEWIYSTRQLAEETLGQALVLAEVI